MARPQALPRLVFSVLILVGTVFLLYLNPAHEEQDISQPRLDKASQPLGPANSIGQTFHAEHGGLNAISFTLVKYERSQPAPADARLVLILERLDQRSAPITVTMAIEGLLHNQEVRFDFPGLDDSAAGIYRLTLSTSQDYGLAVWHTMSDAYAGGELLLNGSPQAGDMRFSTYYAYRLRAVLADLFRQTNRWAGAYPGLAVILGLPGLAMSPWLLPRKRLRWPVISFYVITLSLASWPLLFLWASVVRVPLSGWHFGIIALTLTSLALAGWLRRWRQVGNTPIERSGAAELVLAVILLVTTATRLLQIRQLGLPNWVDSVHHTLITQLLAATGYVPADYSPFMPVSDFHYHFGFHSSAAVLTWLSPLSSPQAVLLFGQIINVLAPLGLYILTATLTGKRWAGTFAALIGGLVCYMPAYYTTWGRYTQLLGLVLLCGLVSAVYEQIRGSGSKDLKRLVFLSGFLLAGLGLSHYRVLIFAILFILALTALQLVQQRFQNWRSVWGGILASAVLSMLLTAPWIYRFIAQVLPNVNSTYGGWESVEGYNAFPFALFGDTVTKLLLLSSGIAVLWGIIRRKWEIFGVACWVGLCLLLANLHLVGLYDLWLIPNSAVVISFWLPAAFLTGWLAAYLYSWLPGVLTSITSSWHLHLAINSSRQDWAQPITAVAISLLIVFGSWNMVDIINPVTVLAGKEDLVAMEWIAANTPADAHFLVNSRIWVNDLHVGSDAGWWIPFLNGRTTNLPSVLYAQGAADYVSRIRDLAYLVESSKSLDDPAVLKALKAEGITHVYIGVMGGKLMPAALDASRHFQLLFSYGPTRVYALISEPN
ncbi:MAG: hypothetical protein ACYC6L_04835 [Anaerolineae bacterium]